MNQQEMFSVAPIPKMGSKLSAYALRAVEWYAENYNLKIEMSTPPTMNFTMRELGETYNVQLPDVVKEYRAWRKEETKRKARERNQK